MSSTPWKALVRPVVDGEDVSARVVNRPLADLAQRTQYLKEVMDAALVSQVLAERSATLATDVVVGMAVYKDDADGIWKPALATYESDGVLNNYQVPPAGFALGVVLYKHTDTLGIVALAGRALVDLSAVIDGPSGAGQLYLSSSTPGHLTLQRPPGGIPVCYYLPNRQEAYVNAAPKDLLLEHVHFSVRLHGHPAGIPACPTGDTNEISCPDIDSTGWLPADDESFNGLAPDGAKFGYNLSMHPELRAVWPPVPLAGVVLESDGLGVRMGVDVIVDANGIWWMSDTVGESPWKDPWPECAVGGDCNDVQGSDADMDGSYDTPDYERYLILYFLKMKNLTDQTVVTSLTADSPYALYNALGQPASTGNLHLALSGDLVESEADPTPAYPSAIRRIVGRTAYQGPAVARLKGGNSRTRVTGSAGNATDGYSGDVVVSLIDTLGAAGYELPYQLVSLEQATEEYYENIQMLGLPAGRESWVQLKVVVPDGMLSGAGTLKLKAWLLATAAGTAPSFTIEWLKLPAAAAGAKNNLSNYSWVTATTQLQWTATGGGSALLLNDYVTVISDGLEVAAGDLVFARLIRAASDGYAGLIGLLRLSTVLFTE